MKPTIPSTKTQLALPPARSEQSTSTHRPSSAFARYPAPFDEGADPDQIDAATPHVRQLQLQPLRRRSTTLRCVGLCREAF